MEFEFTSYTQSVDFFNTQLQEMYAFVDGCKNEQEDTYPLYVRFAGFALAVGSFALNLAMVLAAIVEPIIKGLANIFGALLSDQCDPSLGAKQITVGLGKNLFFSINPLTYLVVAPLCLTFGMIIIPADTLKSFIKVSEENRASVRESQQSFEAFSWAEIPEYLGFRNVTVHEGKSFEDQQLRKAAFGNLVPFQGKDTIDRNPKKISPSVEKSMRNRRVIRNQHR